MQKVKVLVNGCNGKMGQEVINAIEKDENVEVVCGYDLRPNDLHSFPIYNNLEDIKEKPDVIIDFSVPQATLNILDYAIKNKVPTVIATTGFSEEQMQKIKEASKEIPIFQSYNMSFDIFLMQKVLELVSPYLQNTDIEIIEK